MHKRLPTRVEKDEATGEEKKIYESDGTDYHGCEYHYDIEYIDKDFEAEVPSKFIKPIDSK